MTGKRFSVPVDADEVIGVLHAPSGRPRPWVVAGHGVGGLHGQAEPSVASVVPLGSEVDLVRHMMPGNGGRGIA